MSAYDFAFDTTAEGQQIKCLTVVDEYTSERLAIDVAGSIRSKRVIDLLSKLAGQLPATVTCGRSLPDQSRNKKPALPPPSSGQSHT